MVQDTLARRSWNYPAPEFVGPFPLELKHILQPAQKRAGAKHWGLSSLGNVTPKIPQGFPH